MLLALMPSTASAAPNVTARSAIVMDYETGDILFSRDIDTLRSPASMTKIMTAFIVYEEIAAGHLTFETMIRVSANAERISRAYDWGGRYVRAGSSHSVETMLRLIMLPSHNGACIAVAEHISGSEAAFVRRMNDTARRLGLRGHFGDSFGSTGNMLSARDVAALTREFIRSYPDILRITRMVSTGFAGGTAPNTNRFLHSNTQFWGDADFFRDVDGFKTGTSSSAGPCLSSTAMRDGRRVIVVVMNSAGPATRYHDSRALINFGFSELIRRDNAMNAIQINVTAEQNAVRRNTYYSLTASLANVNTGNFTALGGGWIINGQTISTFGPFVPSSQRDFSLTQLLPMDSPLDTLQIEFFLNLPNGGKITEALQLPVSAEEPLLFRDIYPHWARAYIYNAHTLGLIQGHGDGRFGPEEYFTRAMAAQLLYNLADATAPEVAPQFDDVAAGHWYAGAIAWAAEHDIVQGDGDGLFRPGDSITRQEIFVLLWNFAYYWMEIDTTPGLEPIPPFSDLDLVGDWARDALLWMCAAGLVRGNEHGEVNPLGTTTRAESATLMVRFMERITGK